jgi:hypothetical protein
MQCLSVTSRAESKVRPACAPLIYAASPGGSFDSSAYAAVTTLDLLLQSLSLLASFPEIVLRLPAHPAFRRGVEGDRQADGHLRADPGTTVENLRKSLAADPEGFGSPGHRKTKRFET